jgi:HEAT repeat protein
LLRWLPAVDEPGVKEDIVRGLSVSWVANRATAQLIEEFKKSVGSRPALAWAIGNALSIVSVDGFENQIIELARNPAYGMARQMIVMGLGRLRGNSAAEDAALGLLHDENVRLHAVIALGRMKSKRAVPELEKLLSDKKAAVRKEARKALTEISRQDRGAKPN